ncbi:MAG: phosphoribosylglycinamide formyltransferase [Gammaproteobacteria bacterium]
MTDRLRVVVLASGRGSNLQAIIDAAAGNRIPATVEAVISDRADAYALERARRPSIVTHTLSPCGFQDRQAYDAALADLIDSHAPGLVALAGFMRILGPAFVERYAGRMLNIHPSLLPAYTGLDTHRRVIDAGEAETGASVHFVTDALDAGPVIVQSRVEVRPGDDAHTLAARVLEREHEIYPLAIGWFAEGRLGMRDGRVWLDGKPLEKPVTVNGTT